MWNGSHVASLQFKSQWKFFATFLTQESSLTLSFCIVTSDAEDNDKNNNTLQKQP